MSVQPPGADGNNASQTDPKVETTPPSACKPKTAPAKRSTPRHNLDPAKASSRMPGADTATPRRLEPLVAVLKKLNQLLTFSPQKGAFQWVVVATAALTVALVTLVSGDVYRPLRPPR